MNWSGLIEALWVVVPAFLLALSIRLDSRLIGPYFAMSSIITGMEGMADRWWYEKPKMRSAFLRRLLYPAFFGFGLAFIDPERGATAWAVGTLAAILLIWPTIFHGLPSFVSRRDWEIRIFYAAFVMTYAALAQFGYFFWLLIQTQSKGKPINWMADQTLGAAGTFAAGLILAGIWHRANTSLSSKVIERERNAYEGSTEILDRWTENPGADKPQTEVRFRRAPFWILLAVGGLGSIAAILAIRAQNRKLR